MISNNAELSSYKRTQRKIDLEKLGSILAVGMGYYFGGSEAAIIVGLIVLIYSLSEIEKLLNYQNFLKEQEINSPEK